MDAVSSWPIKRFADKAFIHLVCESLKAAYPFQVSWTQELEKSRC
jgi:hypothetical protein